MVQEVRLGGGVTQSSMPSSIFCNCFKIYCYKWGN